jgi:hypothetical protein
MNFEKLSTRDRRALMLLAIALALFAIFYLVTAEPSQPTAIVSPVRSPLQAERQLNRMRQLASEAPGKERALQEARSVLERREAGIIRTDTAAQAQAQLFQILRRVARAQTPPVEPRGFENGQVRPLGDHYGEAIVSVQFDARIEQIVNLLAELTSQPELIATQEIRMGAAQGKEKVIPVRLTVSGMVPRALVPEKRGLSTL